VLVRERLVRDHRAGPEPAPVEGRQGKEHAVHEGEGLRLVLTLDTKLKEAVDLPKVTSQGFAILAEARAEARRHEVPVEFTYSIRVPVLVLPKPHIDFGQLPRCAATSRRSS
jgi:hypothetical protein